MEEIKGDTIITILALHIGYQDSNGWHDVPNNVGGVSVRINFKNMSSIPIKYITFSLVPYNNVGDIVMCLTKRRSEARMKQTGPIQPNQVRYPTWENMWYNSTITSAKITKIEIEYMDGSKKEIDGSEIEVQVSKGNGGCYIATAVYGSYNCPEVWILRRYRDNALTQTWYGRAFIRTYYAISPTVVKIFGDTTWFNRFWRNKLDKLITILKTKGYSDIPYSD